MHILLDFLFLPCRPSWWDNIQYVGTRAANYHDYHEIVISFPVYYARHAFCGFYPSPPCRDGSCWVVQAGCDIINLSKQWCMAGKVREAVADRMRSMCALLMSYAKRMEFVSSCHFCHNSYVSFLCLCFLQQEVKAEGERHANHIYISGDGHKTSGVGDVCEI